MRKERWTNSLTILIAWKCTYQANIQMGCRKQETWGFYEQKREVEGANQEDQHEQQEERGEATVKNGVWTNRSGAFTPEMAIRSSHTWSPQMGRLLVMVSDQNSELDSLEDDCHLELGAFKRTFWIPKWEHDTLWLCQNSYGKSPFSMGKPTITGNFP